MIYVEAVDGKLYANPVIECQKAILEINDDGAFVKHVGNVTWQTARRKMAAGGVKSMLVESLGKTSTIIEGRFVSSSVFSVKVRGPIPVPESHQGVVKSVADAALLDAESIYSWTN